jgi:hypothetical protein
MIHSYEPVSTFKKTRFDSIYLSYVILSALDVKISCLQLWEGTDIAF